MSKTTPEEALKLAEKHGLILWRRTGVELAALIDEVRGVDAEMLESLRDALALHDKYPGQCGTWEQWIAKLDAAIAHPAPSQPAAAVELPVVAWMMEWTGHSPSLTTDKTDYLERDRDLLIPLVKLSDAQAAISAAGRKAS